MICAENFRVFHENISLKKTREERIDDALSALREFVSNDRSQEPQENGVGDLLIEPFVQGSYAMGTPVRPVREADEFDVDVVLSLRLGDAAGNLPNSKTTLGWLAGRLRGSKNYAEKAEVRKRCVRINYAGEFHLDMVPVTPVPGQDPILYLPDKAGYWIKTNPKGFTLWFDGKESESGGRLKRVVKYLKWWRSAVAPRRVKATSVILTTLLANHAARGSSNAEMLVGTMESLGEWLSVCAEKPRIPNPSLPESDLAEKWTEKEFKDFSSRFEEVLRVAREALDEPDYEKSVKLWQKVFGKEFPMLDGDKGGYVPPRSSGRKSTRVFG